MAIIQTQTKKFTPSVTAPLENWDNTTDAIVWIIEQKQAFNITQYPDITLEQHPEHYRGNIYNFMETQSAELKGYITGRGEVRYILTAEYKDNLTDPETNETVEGYTVTVERRFLNHLKMFAEKFATYQIIGSDREEFKIINEKLEA
jgi:hypothetical protein